MRDVTRQALYLGLDACSCCDAGTGCSNEGSDASTPGLQLKRCRFSEVCSYRDAGKSDAGKGDAGDRDWMVK